MPRPGFLVLLVALLGCEDPPPPLTPQRIEAPAGTAKALLDTRLANAPVDAGVLDDHRWDFSVMHPVPMRRHIYSTGFEDAGR